MEIRAARHPGLDVPRPSPFHDKRLAGRHLQGDRNDADASRLKEVPQQPMQSPQSSFGNSGGPAANRECSAGRGDAPDAGAAEPSRDRFRRGAGKQLEGVRLKDAGRNQARRVGHRRSLQTGDWPTYSQSIISRCETATDRQDRLMPKCDLRREFRALSER
jgi:hypothetical protein